MSTAAIQLPTTQELPAAAVPSPATATHALSDPTFWQNGQFFPLCQFLFTEYEAKPVWTHMRPESFRQLCIHLHKKINNADGSENYSTQLIKNTYFLIIKTVRGIKTNQQFHAAESPEFLRALYVIYKYLLTFTQMPLFGHLPTNY